MLCSLNSINKTVNLELKCNVNAINCNFPWPPNVKRLI